MHLVMRPSAGATHRAALQVAGRWRWVASGFWSAGAFWGRATAVEGARPTAIPVAANGAVQVTYLAAVAASFYFSGLLPLIWRVGVAVAAAVTGRIRPC